jgi:hypothetical protein
VAAALFSPEKKKELNISLINRLTPEAKRDIRKNGRRVSQKGRSWEK